MQFSCNAIIAGWDEFDESNFVQSDTNCDYFKEKQKKKTIATQINRNETGNYDFLFNACNRCCSLICLIFGFDSIGYMHALHIIYVELNEETKFSSKWKQSKCFANVIYNANDWLVENAARISI